VEPDAADGGTCAERECGVPTPDDAGVYDDATLYDDAAVGPFDATFDVTPE
jgi:hypothetical protein